MLRAVLPHGLGRRLRLRLGACSTCLVSVAPELLLPVTVQVVRQRLVVLPMIYLFAVLVYIIVVLAKVLALDHASETPQLRNGVLRDAVGDHVDVEAVRRFSAPVYHHDLCLRVSVCKPAPVVVSDALDLFHGMRLKLRAECQRRVAARRAEVGVDKRRKFAR